MLETFGYLEELHQAVLACRDVNPKIPIIAQVTIDEDGNCLDGSDPETFAARLTEWNVDVLGINCSVGPGRHAGRHRTGASGDFPAAGRAAKRRHAALGRRTKYLSLFARIHGELHAKIRGCGSAVDRRMLWHHARSYPRHEVGFARARSARQDRGSEAIHSASAPSGPASIPMAERSRLGAKIAAGEFVTMVEIVPPKGIDIKKEIEGAKFVKSVGVDAVNIPDSPRASARMSNQALSLLMQQAVGIEAVLHYTCRDRNVLWHSVRPAGSGGNRNQQSDLHHRRSPEDGELSRCHGGF